MVRLIESTDDTLYSELSKVASTYGLIKNNTNISTTRREWASIYTIIWYDPATDTNADLQLEITGLPGVITTDNITDMDDIVNDLTNSYEALKEMISTYNRITNN